MYLFQQSFTMDIAIILRCRLTHDKLSCHFCQSKSHLLAHIVGIARQLDYTSSKFSYHFNILLFLNGIMTQIILLSHEHIINDTIYGQCMSLLCMVMEIATVVKAFIQEMFIAIDALNIFLFTNNTKLTFLHLRDIDSLIIVRLYFCNKKL